LLATALKRVQERTGMVATEVSSPKFVDTVTRLRGPRSEVPTAATTAAQVRGPRSQRQAVETPPWRHSAQQAVETPPWRRCRSPSPSSESESPEEKGANLPVDMARDAWACPECKSINLRFHAMCCLCNAPVPFLQEPRAGDWLCGKCGNTNFARRTWCAWSTCATRDWLCRCGNGNFARRATCNMRSCGLPRPW
jgi:hypothetical protein